MKANYIAKKSAWSVGSSIFWGILLFILIVPLISMIIKIMEVKKREIQFFDNKVVVKKGLLSTSETQSALTKIMAVSIHQTFWGRICNYGTVKLDVVGKWDIDLSWVKNPDGLKGYIENVIAGTDYTDLKQVVHN